MISLRFFACACVALGGLTACAAVPNDVSPRQQAIDAGRPLNGNISTAVIETPSRPAGVGPGGVGIEAGATGDVTFLDPSNLEAVAAGAIARSEGAATSGGSGGVFDSIQPQQAGDVLPPPLIPRVAAFAIRTTHQLGQRQWRRNPLRADGQSICTQFPTRDQAQDRFLRDGGPERDPNGLDADGDGFVCGFDPTDLRASANAPTETFDTLPAIAE